MTKQTKQRHRAPRIVLFNHKGGVGKTTLTVNIAYALSTMGKRVLLVDSDPQCNMTSYLVEAELVDRWLDGSDRPDGKTIWTGLKPVVDMTGDVKSIAPSEVKGVHLLPGDIRLSEYEQDLGQMWGECFQRKVRGFRVTTALSQLVDIVAEKKDIDFVFYDVGPNIGPLNRAILLDCDWFIVPAACDHFSVRALKTLGHTVASWVQDWKTITQLAPDGVYLLPGMPRFLGFVLQRFRLWGGEITSGFQQYVADLDRHVASDIVVALRGIDKRLVPGSLSQFRLGNVKDFGDIVSKAQKQGVPIQSVNGGVPTQKTAAATAFRGLAEKIISRTTAAAAPASIRLR